MKKIKDNFERNWLFLFLLLYMLIMVPLPWYYNIQYNDDFFGVPLFLFGWLLHGFVILVLTIIYACLCMKRPEYKNFEEEES
ncbi:hypothetical protein RHO15_05745 [Utexia brackfieldae]|uniref:hypothetical protein n=1 Tax=Utexia brackfieldae TaxID=3074108 RepID=UPI00370DC124